MLHCAHLVAGQGPSRSIFAYRHGEVARTLPVLEDLAQGLPPSPTQFSMNVHNAIAGIWSISRQDQSPSTAVAAGPKTFLWGLVEAQALHLEQPDRPVLFVFGHAPLPTPLAAFETDEPPMHALAFLIGLPAVHHLCLAWAPGTDGSPAGAAPQAPGTQVFSAPGGPWTSADGTWGWHVE
jgi:hypothetical protein